MKRDTTFKIYSHMIHLRSDTCCLLPYLLVTSSVQFKSRGPLTHCSHTDPILSNERSNLCDLYSHKFSGFANRKTGHVALSASDVTLATMSKHAPTNIMWQSVSFIRSD